MNYITTSMDYGKSFLKGSWNGYNGISKAQNIAYYASGQWIGDKLCQHSPCKQLIESINTKISAPIQSLTDKYSSRRFRAITEGRIRPLVQQNLTIASQSMIPIAAAITSTLAERVTWIAKVCDLVQRIWNAIRELFGKANINVDNVVSAQLNQVQSLCEDEVTAAIMDVLDEQIFNKTSVLVKQATSDASKYLLEIIIGNQIYQLALQGLASQLDENSPVLTVIDTATTLSSFKVTALATTGVGLAYLAPVLARRMNHKSTKDLMKATLIQEMENKLTPICKSASLAKTIATNTADIAIEIIF